MKGNTHMKLDIVRAWKDETYRQSLSDEQLSLLPSHPAGGLGDTDLEMVSGGGGESGWNGLGIAGSSSSNSATLAECLEEHRHSLSVVICDANVFSVIQAVIPIIPLISPTTAVFAQRP